MMKCRLSYVHPLTSMSSQVEFQNEIVIGRSPGNEGLSFETDDATISSRAIILRCTPLGLQIINSSTYSEIEVFVEVGVRLVFPGESVVTSESCQILITGQQYRFRLEVEVLEIQSTSPVAASGTQRLIEEVRIAPERWLVAVALCASKFYPDRFGVQTMSASEISIFLKQRGLQVTPKAINHKIQRLREDIEERSAIPLNNREDLVEFLVRNKVVSRDDVKELFGN
jgi:hypothetical protein